MLKLKLPHREVTKALMEKRDIFLLENSKKDRWELRLATRPYKTHPRAWMSRLICCDKDKNKVLERAQDLLPKEYELYEYQPGFDEHIPTNFWTNERKPRANSKGREVGYSLEK